MASMSGHQPITAEELLQIDDSDHRFELVRGELRRMSAAGYMHGVVIGRLNAWLAPWVRDHRLGHVCGAETGFMLERSPDTVRAPDVAFVSAARHVNATAFFPGPPDLAVEVVSPSDTFSRVQEKALSWLESGTKAVWVVDPAARAVTVYQPDGNRLLRGDVVLTDADLLPGLEIPIAELFAID